MSTKTLSNTKPYEAVWKNIANNKQNTSEITLLLVLIKAANAKAENKIEVLEGLLLKTFTPITNEMKLANGQNCWGNLYLGVQSAVRLLRGSISHYNIAKVKSSPYLGTASFVALWESQDEVAQLVIKDVLLEHLRDNLRNIEDNTYAYFFVRQDISPAQQLVQCAHVAQVLGHYDTKSDPHNQHFVVFGVANHDNLVTEFHDVWSLGLEAVEFYEPDMNNEMTAFVVYPIRQSLARRKGAFKNAKLLVL